MLRIEISGQLEALVRSTIDALEVTVAPNYRHTIPSRLVGQALCNLVRDIAMCSPKDFNNFAKAGNALPPTEPIPGIGITWIAD